METRHCEKKKRRENLLSRTHNSTLVRLDLKCFRRRKRRLPLLLSLGFYSKQKGADLSLPSLALPPTHLSLFPKVGRTS
jgi:hypothetical protein